MADGCGDIWAGSVTWVLVFAGWYAVHKTTLIRERRKEKREAAQQLCVNLRKLESSAIDFHTATHRDGRKATDLRQDTERIILQLQRLPLKELDVPLHRMIALRQRITRHNIDPSDFASQLADSQLIYEIRNAITDLIASVEDEREKQWA